MTDMKGIDSLTRMRDAETAKSNLAQIEMRKHFSLELHRVEGLIRDFNGTFGRKVEIFEQ